MIHIYSLAIASCMYFLNKAKQRLDPPCLPSRPSRNFPGSSLSPRSSKHPSPLSLLHTDTCNSSASYGSRIDLFPAFPAFPFFPLLSFPSFPFSLDLFVVACPLFACSLCCFRDFAQRCKHTNTRERKNEKGDMREKKNSSMVERNRAYLSSRTNDMEQGVMTLSSFFYFYGLLAIWLGYMAAWIN